MARKGGNHMIGAITGNRKVKMVLAFILAFCVLFGNLMTSRSRTVVNADESVDNRITVSITGRDNASTAETGERLTATIYSTYSKANDDEGDQTIYIHISELPEGVSIVGFTNNQMTIAYGDNNENTLIAYLVACENGGYDVYFTQPAGSTVEFDIMFDSTNGTMPASSYVELTVEKIVDSDTKTESTASNDDISADCKLTWTAKNEWDAVDKKVNSADSNTIVLGSDGTLSGDLVYTITAASSNNDSYGEIWTAYIKVTDTLTLPEGITFPSGMTLNAAGTAFVDASGNEVLTLTDVQGATVESYTISSDGTTLTYTLKVPNSYLDNGVPTQEMDNLSLKLTLHASTLVVDDSLKSLTASALAEKTITNAVTIQPVPYQTYDVPATSDSVVTTLEPQPEEFTFTKTANKTTVTAGETITYTLTITNTGSVALAAKDDDGNYYTVTDTLPGYLYLTSDQISALAALNITYDSTTNTLTWIPSTTDIAAGETVAVSFEVTVKDGDASAMSSLYNGAAITNSASYKGENASVSVEYKRAVVTVSKKNSDSDNTVANGDTISYTITAANTSDIDTYTNEVLTDTLPSGLEFTSLDNISITVDGNTYSLTDRTLTDNGDGTYSFTCSTCGKTHTVTFTQSGQTLTWDLGILHAGETVTIAYTCTVDTDELGTTTSSITNSVSGTSGESDNDTVGVDYPLDIDKAVTSTGSTYADGDTISYSITVTNDADHPSTETSITVTDVLDAGLIPNYTLYNASGTEVTWEYFLTSDRYASGYYTIINGDTVAVSGSWDYKITLTWTIATPAAGEPTVLTYDVTLDVQDGVTSYTNTAKLKDKSSEVTITGGSDEDTSGYVDLQKSVYAIAEDTGAWSCEGLNSKEAFSDDLAGSGYVVYSVSVINTGNESVTLSTLEDQLPDELSYVGIYGYSYNQLAVSSYSNSATTAGNSNNVVSYSGTQVSVNLTAAYDDSKKLVTITVGDGTGYSLEGGCAISFLIMCRIDKATDGVPITNTAKLYVDEDVTYKDYDEIETYKTPYDANQNNGSSQDEGVKNGVRTISSSVTITPEEVIVPGIAKEAVSYILTGSTTETALTDDSVINPQAAVKWEITLYNSGTTDLSGYTVADAVTASYAHLITEDEATAKGISSAYYITIYSSSGTATATYDISEEVWKAVTGTSTSEMSQSYTFDFTDSKYTIPAGGYAVLTIWTNNDIVSYETYKNTATLYPSQSFDYIEVKHGELVKDDDGNYIGITSSDEVNALSSYASLSWKTITEYGNESNTAKGSDDTNYITVDEDTDTVIYTNNIKNASQYDFTDITVIDLLPGLNDTGVVNQSDVRGSEFAVALLTGSLSVYVLDASGTQTAITDYTLEFSSKVSFTDDDFNGVSSSDWSTTADENTKSFRVVMSDGFALASGSTLVVEYSGKISDSAAPGQIAWNSFGYRYTANKQTLTAEPPKVGVKIPYSPTIQKTVVDEDGNTLEYDGSVTFKFKLEVQNGTDENNNAVWEEVGTFTLCQGGYAKLSELTDTAGNAITLTDGSTYRISEMIESDEYELVSIVCNVSLSDYSDSDSTAFTYYSNKNITISVTNKFKETGEEFPSTGGIGTKAYATVGMLLMMAAALYVFLRRNRKGRRSAIPVR